MPEPQKIVARNGQTVSYDPASAAFGGNPYITKGQGLGNLPESATDADIENAIEQELNNKTISDWFNPGQKDKDRRDYYKDILARNYSEKQAKEDREFQLLMANTAVQRRVKDLEAAGLNPALALLASGAAVGGADVPGNHINKWTPHSREAQSQAKPAKDITNIITLLLVAAKLLA